MDGADRLAKRDGAVGANERAMPPLRIDELDTGRHKSPLDERREWHPRCLACGHEGGERRFGQRLDCADAVFRGGGVIRLSLDPDETSPQSVRHRAGGSGTAEWVQHYVVGPRSSKQHARQQGFWLLRRMQLLT